MKKNGSPRDGNYVVGKGRRPLGSRWKAGQTGNPKGRPKAKKDLLAYIDDALRRTIKMKEASAFRNVTVREAIAIRMANQALMGDPKFVSLIMAISRKNSLIAEQEIVVWRKDMTTREAYEAYMKVVRGANVIWD